MKFQLKTVKNENAPIVAELLLDEYGNLLLRLDGFDVFLISRDGSVGKYILPEDELLGIQRDYLGYVEVVRCGRSFNAHVAP